MRLIKELLGFMQGVLDLDARSEEHVGSFGRGGALCLAGFRGLDTVQGTRMVGTSESFGRVPRGQGSLTVEV